MAIGPHPTIAELLNTLDPRITKYIKYKNPNIESAKSKQSQT